jgi:hypothetical protein
MVPGPSSSHRCATEMVSSSAIAAKDRQFLPYAKRLAAAFQTCRASQDVTIAYCPDALDQAGAVRRVHQSAPRQYDRGLENSLRTELGGDASIKK